MQRGMIKDIGFSSDLNSKQVQRLIFGLAKLKKVLPIVFFHAVINTR
jgi:hypothetical protein